MKRIDIYIFYLGVKLHLMNSMIFIFFKVFYYFLGQEWFSRYYQLAAYEYASGPLNVLIPKYKGNQLISTNNMIIISAVQCSNKTHNNVVVHCQFKFHSYRFFRQRIENHYRLYRAVKSRRTINYYNYF